MKRTFLSAVLAMTAVLLMPISSFAQGLILPASGAVNRGMGGATTGAAVEAIGSMAWNPATIGGLQNEMGFSFETIFQDQTISSTIPGLGSGTTSSEAGVGSVPTFAWVFRNPNRCNVTYGVGLFGFAGSGANYPADTSNPILSQNGFGRIHSESAFFQMPFTVALQLTPRLTVAGGPIATIAKILIDENAFVPANADGSYPDGVGTRLHFGGGAQIGAYYVHNCCWSFGANLKSPGWLEPLRYFGEDENGNPRVDEVNLDIPLLASVGAGYRPNPNTLLTVDLRYVNYNDAEGFGEPAEFLGNLAVDGLGWDDAFSVQFGSLVRLTERLYMTGGYIFITDMVPDESAMFNITTDLGYEHIASVGGSYALSPTCKVSAAYAHVFEWGSTGPVVTPAGPINGSVVDNNFTGDVLTLGLNVTF